MTQKEIDQIKAADGLYILGNHSHPFFTHLVCTLAGGLYAVSPAGPVHDEATHWSDDSYLVAGPLTVQRMRDLNEKAQQVEELVLTLQHDLEVWHQRALTAEAKLQRMKK